MSMVSNFDPKMQANFPVVQAVHCLLKLTSYLFFFFRKMVQHIWGKVEQELNIRIWLIEWIRFRNRWFCCWDGLCWRYRLGFFGRGIRICRFSRYRWGFLLWLHMLPGCRDLQACHQETAVAPISTTQPTPACQPTPHNSPYRPSYCPLPHTQHSTLTN